MAYRTFGKIVDFAVQSNHTPKRFVNKMLSVVSKSLGLTRSLGFPSHLMIEVSSACQLKCPLCPLGNGRLSRPRQLMKMQTFKRIVDDIADYIYHININGMGEPLLNENICEMIRFAKANHIYVDLYTNLQIENQDVIEGLVEAGLDAILISCDGATKDIYEKYRINGDFDRLLNNIKVLVETKKRAKSIKPEVNIQFILFEHNENQLPQMTELVKSLQADNFIIKRPFLFWSDQKDASVFLPKNEQVNMYRRGNPHEAKLRWQGKTKSQCDLLWGSSVILADGAVVPCCFDYDGKMQLGNVNQDSFTAIWNNPSYRSFRRQVQKDWRKIPICNSDFEAGCPNMHIHHDDWLIRADRMLDAGYSILGSRKAGSLIENRASRIENQVD